MLTGYRTDGDVLALLCHGDAERELSTIVDTAPWPGTLPANPCRSTTHSKWSPRLAAIFALPLCYRMSRPVNTRLLMQPRCLLPRRTCGVEMLPGVEVIALAGDANLCTGVKTSTGDTFSAAQVVFATGCWTGQIPEVARYAPTIPVRGQMLALRHAGQAIRHVLRSERAYIVPRSNTSPQTFVVGSTLEKAGYEKCVTSGGVEKNLGGVNEIAPELSKEEIMETWCGLRPGTPDQLPIIGPTDVNGLVIATGHYRNGILLAPVTAKLISEWITDRRTFFDCEPFNPLRFTRGNTDRSATAS